MSYRPFVTATAVFAIALGTAVSAVAQTPPTPAATSRQTIFPPVGLGSTETAEINLVNAASNSSTGTVASCTGTVSFLNATGTTIGTATNFTLAAGQTSSVRLPFSSFGGTSTRPVIRGVITQNISNATPRPPCSLQYSFEIFDANGGATRAVIASGGTAGGGGHF